MLPDRFWARVNKTDTCWLWTGRLDRYGYAQIKFGGRQPLVHRLAYEDAHGVRLTPDVTIDHLCNVRNCVNPEHLEPCSHSENTKRAAQRRTTCKRGHPITEDSHYVYRRGEYDYRACKACKPLYVAEARNRHLAAA